MGIQVPVQGKLPEGIYACAAKGDQGKGLMIANINTEPVEVRWDFQNVGEFSRCRIIQKDNTWEHYTLGDTLPPESVIYIEFT